MAKAPAATQADPVVVAATAAGVDWQALVNLITTMNWSAFIQFIMTLIGIFKGSARKMKAGQGCGPDELSAIRAHFDAIAALAACGSECCGGK
jgi:hypothetical protein